MNPSRRQRIPTVTHTPLLEGASAEDMAAARARWGRAYRMRTDARAAAMLEALDEGAAALLRVVLVLALALLGACTEPAEPEPGADAAACFSRSDGVCVTPTPDAAPLPRCAALGCPLAPSGSPDAWEPCDADAVCYCGSPALVCAP